MENVAVSKNANVTTFVEKKIYRIVIRFWRKALQGDFKENEYVDLTYYNFMDINKNFNLNAWIRKFSDKKVFDYPIFPDGKKIDDFIYKIISHAEYVPQERILKFEKYDSQDNQKVVFARLLNPDYCYKDSGNHKENDHRYFILPRNKRSAKKFVLLTVRKGEQVNVKNIWKITCRPMLKGVGFTVSTREKFAKQAATFKGKSAANNHI